MPYALHMHPYLVCAPRFELAFHIAKTRSKVFNRRYMRYRFPAARHYRHFLSVRRVAPDRLVHGARLLDSSESDGVIHPRYAVRFQLLRKKQMRRIVFRNNEQPARVLVYPMDNSGS